MRWRARTASESIQAFLDRLCELARVYQNDEREENDDRDLHTEILAPSVH